MLDSLVSLLLEVETVDGAEVYRLAGQPDRSSIVPPLPPTTAVTPRAAATDASAGPMPAPARPMPADAAPGPFGGDRPDSG